MRVREGELVEKKAIGKKSAGTDTGTRSVWLVVNGLRNFCLEAERWSSLGRKKIKARMMGFWFSRRESRGIAHKKKTEII